MSIKGYAIDLPGRVIGTLQHDVATGMLSWKIMGNPQVTNLLQAVRRNQGVQQSVGFNTPEMDVDGLVWRKLTDEEFITALGDHLVQANVVRLREVFSGNVHR